MRTTPPNSIRCRIASIEGSLSLISNEKLVAIHAAIVKCRMIEQRAELLFQRGKLKGDFQKSIGREASAVAFVIDLQPGDVLCLHDEDMMPAFVKGASLEDFFRSPSDRPADFKRLDIVGASNAAAQIAAVRESALAAKGAKTSTIVMAFPASVPDSRAKWDAAMSLAGSKGLPVIFVVHGAWGTHEGPGTPDARQNGIPAIAVDASDAIAAYRVACEAITRARQGRGPTLVECLAVPYAGADLPAPDRIHLRTEGRVSADPNLAMKDYLKRKGLWSEENHQQSVADFEQELDLATGFLND
jgi:TPP-dependent pyruvate/acetoin dehydrogenase alpha subunit